MTHYFNAYLLLGSLLNLRWWSTSFSMSDSDPGVLNSVSDPRPFLRISVSIFKSSFSVSVILYRI